MPHDGRRPQRTGPSDDFTEHRYHAAKEAEGAACFDALTEGPPAHRADDSRRAGAHLCALHGRPLDFEPLQESQRVRLADVSDRKAACVQKPQAGQQRPHRTDPRRFGMRPIADHGSIDRRGQRPQLLIDARHSGKRPITVQLQAATVASSLQRQRGH